MSIYVGDDIAYQHAFSVSLTRRSGSLYRGKRVAHQVVAHRIRISGPRPGLNQELDSLVGKI